MRSGKNVPLAVKAFVLLLGAAMLWPSFPVAAQGDNVQIMVCPQPHESSFVVIAPESDSIVNEPKLTVSGSVEYISQIDFFIDDTYNHTEALGYAAANFESSVTLSPGTHTLKLIASDSCSHTTHEQSVVVTYEPKVAPSVGNTVPTAVDDKEVPPDAVADEPQSQPTIIERHILPPLRDIADALDLTDPANPEDRYSPLPNVGRAALFVTGAALTVSGVYVGSLVALPAHMTFIQPFRREFIISSIVSGMAMLGAAFAL